MVRQAKQIDAHIRGKKKNTKPFTIAVPEGWDAHGACIVRSWPFGLHAVFSHDLDMPGGRSWRHLSVSRINQYPGWDELKRVVYTKGLFDLDKDIVMVMPKPEEQAVAYPYVLHFWQED